VSQSALLACIALSLVQVHFAFSPHQTLLRFMPVMAANICAMGFIGANFSSIALQPFARTAGAASSMQMFMRTLIGSLIGIAIGQVYDGTARPLSLASSPAACSRSASCSISERGRLFRRLIPPGGERVLVDLHWSVSFTPTAPQRGPGRQGHVHPLWPGKVIALHQADAQGAGGGHLRFVLHAFDHAFDAQLPGKRHDRADNRPRPGIAGQGRPGRDRS
jgi:hypothetical protein